MRTVDLRELAKKQKTYSTLEKRRMKSHVENYWPLFTCNKNKP
jgi:hypothetical protein